VTAKELYQYIEDKIPLSLSCEWDVDGFIGNKRSRKKVKKVLITLDVTDNAAVYAKENGFDVIVSHHPLMFDQEAEYDISMPRYKIILDEKSVSQMSFHTRLDAVDGGTGDVLAKLLGIEDTEPFGEGNIGKIGCFSKEKEIDVLISEIKEKLGCMAVRAVGKKKTFKRAAVVGGSGKDFWEEALKLGADVYITGAMSYHTMVDAAQTQFTVIEAGHYYTEQPVCNVLEKIVRSADDSIYTEIFESNVINIY